MRFTPRSDQPDHMAIAGQIPVVPLVSEPIQRVVDFRNKRFRRGVYRIKALPPVSVEGMTPNDVDRLSQIVREKMSEAFRGLVSRTE